MKTIRRSLALLGALLFVSTAAFAAQKQVLILYDRGADPLQPALTDARYLSNLLGHFNVSVVIRPLNEYKLGEMNSSDIIFYINYEKEFLLPAEFKNDFYKNKKTFCWLNHQIKLLDQNFLKRNYGFHFQRYSENQGFNKVIYKGTVFPKGDDNVNIVQIDNPSLAEVVCFAFDKKNEKAPYIVKARNLWFVADSPFSYFTEQDRYILFADLLHEIVGENHPEKHMAFVRIEDVNATTEPKGLLKIAKYLHSNNIPFAIALVPVYIDPDKKLEYHLEDKPALLSVLKKLPSLGGTFVMHGYTHQYHGVSTDDYEFWDDVADKPVRGDSVEYASRRLEKGVKELYSNGIYPFAWETPHYFASRNAYLAIRKYFSLTYDRRGVMDYLGSDQFFPYMVKDMYGQRVLPEDLGYVHEENPDTADVLGAAKLEYQVRDGCASFFFHPFLDIKYLRQIIDSLKNMGYAFADIKTFGPEVTTRDKAVLTGSKKLNIESKDKYISIERFDFKGKVISQKEFPNTPGAPYRLDIKCPPGEYVVVKTEDELEPGFFVKVWRLAKADISYLKSRNERRNAGMISHIPSVVFISPSTKDLPAEELKDMNSLKFSLTVMGVKFLAISQTDIKNADLRDYDIIMLPYAAAKRLKDEDIPKIKEAVRSGSGIVLDGVSKLADELGIELQIEPVSVKQIRDYQFPEVPLYWPTAASVRPVFKAAEKEYKILCVEEESNLPIVVGGKFGKGAFLYFSALFDPVSDRGYSRFPFLAETLGAMFDYNALAERKTSEMYFDPGMRQFISIEKLAKLWKKYGIKRIYAGGWHFYDKYSYDYARLVKVCHQNGILVYCWLEPPMVNQKFWNKYPEWREKTALLRDAKVSWRFLMNMADKKCREKVYSETETLLTRYDWDGVNLAEFYFESSGGPARPDNFTPMNDTVRKEYKTINGYDPIEIFKPESEHYWQKNGADWDKFAGYRIALCNKLKSNYVAMLMEIKKKKIDFEVMVTAIDVVMSPGMGKNIAEDTDNLISMRKKFDFTLQVEDPSIFWKDKPERYEFLGRHYSELVKEKDKLVLDCNVLNNHKKGEGGLPAEKPTGEEIRQIAYNMDLTKSRPAFYSEDSIYENDFKNISTILARETDIKQENESQWRVNSPFMVTLITGKKDLMVKLDDEPWFAFEGENVIVPAGEHTLRFESEKRYFDVASLKPRLRYISSELKWANFLNNAIEFSYEGDEAPTYAVINKRPDKIFIEGKKTSCDILEGDSGFSIKLPAGSHVVKIIAGGSFSHLIETSGVILFSIVFIFGVFSSVLFLGLFIGIQIKRKLEKQPQ